MPSDPSIPPHTETESPSGNAPPPSNRKRFMLLVSGLFAFAAVGMGLYYMLHGRFYENTDDAYVNGNIVQITSQIGGTITAVHVDDTQKVEAGAPLIELDSADATVALHQARAALAEAVRQTRTVYIHNDTYRATVAQRRVDLERTRSDLTRRVAMAQSGAISAEEMAHARATVQAAQAALDAAQQQLAANLALTDKLVLEKHPTVLNAAAQLRNAYLNFARTRLPAPVGGYIAKRSAQLGQRIAPGNPLMAIVPLNELWVDANFKEGQLRRIRIGQPVELHADAYGSDVVYRGKVIGLSAGTGSAFSLLPAQNATGNWIKVVQRLPVRIALDPEQLKAHPLRIGFSMQVKVDAHRAPISPAFSAFPFSSVQSTARYQTQVFKDYGKEADAEIQAIIERHSEISRNSDAKKKGQ